VSDPWFGTYVLVSGTGGAEFQILVGPLFQRVLRLESISNSGPSIVNNGMREKSCQHSYVEGSITGTVPDGVWPEDGVHYWVDINGSDCSFETTFFNGAFRWEREVKAESTASADGGGLGLDITVDFKYIRDFDSFMCNRYQATINLQFVCVTNADKSKSYTLSDFTYTTTPDGCFGIGAGQVSSPFGSGGDSLQAAFGAVGDTATAFQDTVEKAGKTVSLRDAAIYDALDNISLADVNPLEDIKDLLRPLEPLKQLISFTKVHGFMDMLKTIANLHLFLKYVVKTGIMNIGEWNKLLDAMCHPEKLKKAIAGSQLIGRGKQTKKTTLDDDSTLEVTHYAKLVYNTQGVDITNLLNLLGLTPRLADLWDLIPFSFVVDWLLPIGEAINNLELNSLQQTLPFTYGIITKKVTGSYSRKFTAGVHEYTLKMKAVSYDRTVVSVFPTDVWFGVSLKDPSKQLLTGGALLVQFASKK